MIWCRKVLWSCTTASGTEADEPLQTRKERHERVLKMLKIILKLEEGKTREMMDRRGRRKKSHQERMRSFFMAQEDLWDTAQKKCKHCTILAHIPHFRTRGFFSRGTSLCLCLDNTTFTSGTMFHAQPLLFLYLTSHTKRERWKTEERYPEKRRT